MKNPALTHLRGYVAIRVRDGQPEQFINALTQAGIAIWDVTPVASDSMELKLHLKDFYDLRPILRRTGCRMHVTGRFGVPFYAANLWKRKFFAAGMLLFAVILFVMSSLIWDVKVEGNVKLASDDILEVAKQEGIYPFQWTFRLKHPDKLARQLNVKIPNTSWVGVTRRGGAVTIQIVESAEAEKKPLTNPRHIVSKSDAVITDIYSEQGKPLVSKNDRVKKGQILISGVLGNEEFSQIVVAKGTVKGLVWHEYKIEVPTVKKHKSFTGERKDSNFLVLGDWGIQLWGYGKVPYNQYEVVTHYDGLKWRSYQLPIGWMKESAMETVQTSETITAEEAREQGINSAIRDIKAKYGNDSIVISQKILHEKRENGKVYMKVLFEVEENITGELPIVYNQGE